MTTSAALRLPPPTFQLLGAELLEAAEGRARVRFVPGHDTTNPAGLVQGVILAACLDDVMGPAVFSLGRDGFFVTVSMTVSFLGKAEPGHALVGEATVVRAGRRHLYVEARLVRESDGAEVARASATSLLQDGGAS
ncbi:MAG: PaaI family thioesterase [Alphaproteobacteria bacterium]